MKYHQINALFLFISMILFFSLGFLTSDLMFNDLQSPISGFGFAGTIERHGPADRISESDLRVEADGIKIILDDYIIARFADTNSMDPFLDTGSNAIEVRPKDERDLQIGDIVSYRMPGDVTPIIHRIVDIGSDEGGFYYIVKGDNNPSVDPNKVRFHNIEYVLVGILY